MSKEDVMREYELSKEDVEAALAYQSGVMFEVGTKEYKRTCRRLWKHYWT